MFLFILSSYKSSCITSPIILWQSSLCSLTKGVITWLIKLSKEDPSQAVIQRYFSEVRGEVIFYKATGQMAALLLTQDSDIGTSFEPFWIFQSSHCTEHIQIFWYLHAFLVLDR